MRVFVLNKRGKPLMPCSPAKARHLLKEKKAIVVRRTPFTIQLTIATGESKQPVSLGVDAGYKYVGLSASTEKAELYASEVELRQDITDLLSARRSPCSQKPQNALPCTEVRQPHPHQAQRLACTIS